MRVRDVDAAPESTEPTVIAQPPDALARCVARAQSSAPPELQRALAVLDDRILVVDACRLDLALRARDPSWCDGVTLSPLKDACLSRAAMLGGQPARCPSALGARGREPVCVAIASRDVTLCRAAVASERPRCLALARMDRRVCDRVDPLLRPGCTRDVDALAGMLSPVRAAPWPEDTASTLGDDLDGGVSYALTAWSRGVFLDAAGSLTLVDPYEGWPSAYSPAFDAPRVGVRLLAVPGAAAVTSARLSLPGGGVYGTDEGTLRATATVTAAPRRRGDPARGEVVLEGIGIGAPRRMVLRFDTFVRDVVEPAALE